MLQILLTSKSVIGTSRDIGILAVEVFSATESLLRNAIFLIIWYLLIWSLLRWSTRRKVDRLLGGWKSGKNGDDSLNLTTRALAWIDELLEPIHRARNITEDLANRAEAVEGGAGGGCGGMRRKV